MGFVKEPKKKQTKQKKKNYAIHQTFPPLSFSVKWILQATTFILAVIQQRCMLQSQDEKLMTII